MKISGLIVSIILVGLFASVFGVFFSGISTQYGVTYNGSTTFGQNGTFDKINDIQGQTEEIESGLKTEGGDASNFEFVGVFLKKGFLHACWLSLHVFT